MLTFVFVLNWTEDYLMRIRLGNDTHIIRNFFNYTINRITNVLSRSHQQGCNNQNNEGGFIMQSEDIIVNTNCFELYQPFNWRKNVKHCSYYLRLLPKTRKLFFSRIFQSKINQAMIQKQSSFAWHWLHSYLVLKLLST